MKKAYNAPEAEIIRMNMDEEIMDVDPSLESGLNPFDPNA